MIIEQPQELKQVIVVNEGLNMPAGKLAVQVAHASVASFLKVPEEVRAAWMQQGMPKIVLSCSTEQDLDNLKAQARSAGLIAVPVHDAGKTVLPAGTITCIALGPTEPREIDAITGDLQLLR